LIAKLNGDAKQTCAYDAVDQLTLSDCRKVNHLYHGSGHLRQLNVDGHVVSGSMLSCIVRCIALMASPTAALATMPGATSLASCFDAACRQAFSGAWRRPLDSAAGLGRRDAVHGAIFNVFKDR